MNNGIAAVQTISDNINMKNQIQNETTGLLNKSSTGTNYFSTLGTSNSLNSNTANSTSGLIAGNCLTYPYYTTTYTYPTEPSYKIKVEAVENGFIIHKDGKKFVETKAENIVKYLKD